MISDKKCLVPNEKMDAKCVPQQVDNFNNAKYFFECIEKIIISQSATFYTILSHFSLSEIKKKRKDIKKVIDCASSI